MREISPAPGEIVPAAIIIVVLVTAAAGGSVLGYLLSRESRSDRRRGLVIGLVIAAVSPVFHGAAVFIWAGLVGSLAGYVAGRFTVRPGSG